MWGTYLGNKLTCHPSGNACTQSSQLAESLWTVLGLKSGSGVYELISTEKKKKSVKKAQAGNDSFEPHPKILTHKERAAAIQKSNMW